MAAISVSEEHQLLHAAPLPCSVSDKTRSSNSCKGLRIAFHTHSDGGHLFVANSPTVGGSFRRVRGQRSEVTCHTDKNVELGLLIKIKETNCIRLLCRSSKTCLCINYLIFCAQEIHFASRVNLMLQVDSISFCK